ncbi:MAG: methyl-accepting chemotaxis protein [Nitrospirota bacterium]
MKWFRDLRIGLKLSLGFLVIITFMFAIGLAGYISSKNIQRHVDDVFFLRIPSLNYLKETGNNLHQLLVAERSMIFSNPESELFKELKEGYDLNLAQSDERWQKYKTLANSTEEKEIIYKYDRTREEWKELSKKVVNGRVEDTISGRRLAIDLTLGESRKKFEEMRGYLDKLTEINLGIIKSAQNESSKTYKKMVANILAVTGTALLIGILLSWIISKEITSPLKSVVEITKEMSKGHLDKNLDINRKDEIGKLAESFRTMIDYLKGMAKTAEEIAGGDLRSNVVQKSEKDLLGNAFNKMLNGLKSIISNVKTGADEIASASSHIAEYTDQTSKKSESSFSAVEEITATMHEMSANIQSVARNIQSQSASVTETSSSIEQMVSSIQRVAENVKRLVDLAQKALEAVITGRQAVMKASSGMEEINSVTKRAAETIGKLASKSDDIVRIIEVIDDIAEQTNLLALNAAIEAARAGEQGMGFAVVAEEVRKLAERSAKSTREIAELINIVTKESQEAVSHMDNNADIVEQGLILSREVNQALQKIEEAVAEVSKYSQEIGIATVEQSSGSEQIQKAMVSLNDITQEISTSAEEQSSGAEQVVKAIERVREMVQQNASGSVELATSAEQLNKQAESLHAIVGKFSLNGKVG